MFGYNQSYTACVKGPAAFHSLSRAKVMYGELPVVYPISRISTQIWTLLSTNFNQPSIFLLNRNPPGMIFVVLLLMNFFHCGKDHNLTFRSELQ